MLLSRVFLGFQCQNGIAPFLDFQLSFIVSYVHAALGRPTRRFSVVLGISVLVAKVTWCCGWSRDRRMICPNNFFRFSCNTSLRGRMCLFCAEPIASFARLKTSSFVFARSIYVVVMFKIFLSPFSWKIINQWICIIWYWNLYIYIYSYGKCSHIVTI